MCRFSITFFYIFLLFFILIPSVAANGKHTENVAFDDTKISNSTLKIKKEGYLSLNRCNYQEALAFSDSLRKVGEKEGDSDYATLHSYIIEGQANTMLGKPEIAFRNLQEALSLAQRLNYYDALSSVYNGLAIYDEYINYDIYGAISNYYSAIENAQIAGNKRRQAILLDNLAGAYYRRNDPECIIYCNRALEIAKEINDPIAISYAYLNLAEFAVWQRDEEKALRYIEDARKNAIEHNIDALMDLLVIEARFYQSSGQIKKALEICKELMEKTDQSLPIPTIASSYLTYTSVLTSDNQYELALATAQKGLKIMREKGIYINEPEFIDELMHIYEKKGDFKNSLQYARKAIQIRDSTYSVSRERGVEEAKIKYEIYEKEKKIDDQQKEISNNRMRIILLIIFIVLVLTILSLVIFNYQKQKNLYKSIVSQHKQNIQREKLLIEELEKYQQKKNEAKTVAHDKNDSIMASFTTLMIKEKIFKDPSISLATIADKLGTNRTYLSRAINETSGKTFSQVVIEFRIREAISIMQEKEENYPLKMIANEVGFSSISTFYSSFTSMIGMTPAKYRNQMKNS